MKYTTNYKLIGRQAVPCHNLREWVRWMQTAERHVAKTQIGPLYVSTVFLGIDHSFGRDGGPLLFETMVFGGEQSSEFSDSFMERYHTWDEAEKGHAQAVEWARERVAAAEAAIKLQVPC